jgi:hypothetical protein
MDTNITVKLVSAQLTRENAPASAFAELLQGNEILAAEVRCDIVRSYNGVEKIVAKNQLPDSDAVIRNAIETHMGCSVRIIRGSKAYAEAGIVCFVKSDNQFCWPAELDTVKALGVLGQPGAKFETPLAHFTVVETAFDGAIEITRECLNRILVAANKPLVATAVKIAGENGLKAVLFARDGGCSSMLGKIEQGNFKGGKPVVGAIVDSLVGRAVLTDVEYRNCGTWLSYQVLDQFVNGPKLVTERLKAVIDNIAIVVNGINGDRSWNGPAIFAAMDLINIRSAINDEQEQPALPSDWDDSVSTAMHLLEIGANPQHNKRLALLLESILAVRLRDCMKGIPLTRKEIVSGLAIPDYTVTEGEVHVGEMLACSFKLGYAFRYPVGAPDSILKLKVVVGPGNQMRVNPKTWAGIQSDFDGDTMYLVDTALGALRPNLGLVHGDKTEGKKEVTILEEIRNLYGASKLIGRIELLREFIDNVALVYGVCLDGLHRLAAKAYNDSLQAKNRDVSLRGDVNTIQSELKKMGYEDTKNPSRFEGLKKLDLKRIGFNAVVEHCRKFRTKSGGWEKTCRGQAAISCARPNVLLKDPEMMRDEFGSRVLRITPKTLPEAAIRAFGELEGIYHKNTQVGKDTGVYDYKETREWIKKISTEDEIVLADATLKMTPEVREIIAWCAANKVARSNTMSSMIFDHFRQTKLARFVYGLANDIPDTCDIVVAQKAIVPTETN